MKRFTEERNLEISQTQNRPQRTQTFDFEDNFNLDDPEHNVTDITPETDPLDEILSPKGNTQMSPTNETNLETTSVSANNETFDSPSNVCNTSFEHVLTFLSISRSSLSYLTPSELKLFSNYLSHRSPLLTTPALLTAETANILWLSKTRTLIKELKPLELLKNSYYIPIMMICYLTVLPTSSIEYSKQRYIVWSLFGPLSMGYAWTYGNGIFGLYGIATALGLGLVLAVLAVFLLDKNQHPRGILRIILKLLGIICAGTWSWFFCDFMVGVIKGLHVVYGYEYTFMVIGVFSVMVWAPVYVGSIRVVKMLKSVPSFSGVIFNATFVPGMSIVMQVMAKGPLIFDIYPRSQTPSSYHLTIFLLILVAIICLHAVYLKISGFRYTAKFGICLLIIYVALFIYSTMEGIMYK